LKKGDNGMRYLLGLIAVASLCAPAARADAPVAHPYQENSTSSCSLAGDCAVVFPAITTAGNTVIQHAACTFSLAVGGVILFANLTSQTYGPGNAMPIFVYSTSGGTTNYGISSETYLFYAKGTQPRIDVFSNGAGVQNLNCTVSGYF
jgi:hypothetical protein